jgi:hypothetical protein
MLPIPNRENCSKGFKSLSFSQGNVTTDDPWFHEFYSVKASHDESTDVYKRSIKSFVKRVEGESQHGWRIFDP